jgi:phage FluMu protein gp41
MEKRKVNEGKGEKEKIVEEEDEEEEEEEEETKEEFMKGLCGTKNGKSDIEEMEKMRQIIKIIEYVLIVIGMEIVVITNKGFFTFMIFVLCGMDIFYRQVIEKRMDKIKGELKKKNRVQLNELNDLNEFNGNQMNMDQFKNDKEKENDKENDSERDEYMRGVFNVQYLYLLISYLVSRSDLGFEFSGVFSKIFLGITVTMIYIYVICLKGKDLILNKKAMFMDQYEEIYIKENKIDMVFGSISMVYLLFMIFSILDERLNIYDRQLYERIIENNVFLIIAGLTYLIYIKADKKVFGIFDKVYVIENVIIFSGWVFVVDKYVWICGAIELAIFGLYRWILNMKEDMNKKEEEAKKQQLETVKIEQNENIPMQIYYTNDPPQGYRQQRSIDRQPNQFNHQIYYQQNPQQGYHQLQQNYQPNPQQGHHQFQRQQNQQNAQKNIQQIDSQALIPNQTQHHLNETNRVKSGEFIGNQIIEPEGGHILDSYVNLNEKKKAFDSIPVSKYIMTNSGKPNYVNSNVGQKNQINQQQILNYSQSQQQTPQQQQREENIIYNGNRDDNINPQQTKDEKIINTVNRVQSLELNGNQMSELTRETDFHPHSKKKIELNQVGKPNCSNSNELHAFKENGKEELESKKSGKPTYINSNKKKNNDLNMLDILNHDD